MLANNIPESMQTYLHKHHLLSLATQHGDNIWAANCFYAFSAENQALYILSSQKTQHGQGMLASPEVAGTISAETANIAHIQGIQFLATATLLAGQQRETALDIYYHKHPVARLMPADIWQLSLNHLKFTDNKLGFGKKTLWQRGE